MQDKKVRQQRIIELAKQYSSFHAGDVLEVLHDAHVERLTLSRDLAELVEREVLVRVGKGRATAYILDPHFRLHEPIDVDAYYAQPALARNAQPVFNHDIFRVLKTDHLFTDVERARIADAQERYRNTCDTLAHSSPAILKREWERLVVELSWKSSEIEGNTYSLLETEALLQEARLAPGKSQADAQMILNHKYALDTIRALGADYSTCSISSVCALHETLVAKLMVGTGFRDHPVGITGTLYRPLPRRPAIELAMQNLMHVCGTHEDPVVRAFILLVMLSYIQPFEDGNKRTARLAADAHLFAHEHPMLSYRTVDSVEYKKAMLLFYEQNNVSYIKRIFIEQYEYAVDNYFAPRDA